MSEYKFVKFSGQNQRLETRITVTKSYSIGLPSKFYSDNHIKNYKFAVLFWDKSARAIGIHFTNDESEKSKFSILKSKQGYGGSIVARSFFKANDIDGNKYHNRYDWEKIEEDTIGTIYVIELKERRTDDA